MCVGDKLSFVFRIGRQSSDGSVGPTAVRFGAFAFQSRRDTSDGERNATLTQAHVSRYDERGLRHAPELCLEPAPVGHAEGDDAR